MKLLFRSDIVAGAPERWREQYRNTRDADKARITEALLALSPPTSEAINAIIGNKSWTQMSCDNCQQDKNLLLHIGDEPDYDARWQDLCPECLSAAVNMFPAQQPKEPTNGRRSSGGG